MAVGDVSTVSFPIETEPCISVHAFLLRVLLLVLVLPQCSSAYSNRVKESREISNDFATRFRTSSIRRLNNERDEIHRSFSSVKKSFSFSLSLLLFLQFCFSPPLFSISISLALVSPFRREPGHNKSSGFFHFDFAFYRVATLLPGNKHFHIAWIEYFRERERERKREGVEFVAQYHDRDVY